MPKAPTDIRSLARSHTDSALNTLKGIMNQKDAPAAARVSAAMALLDRGWGKPHQESTVNIQRKPVREKTDAELDEILAGIDRGGEGEESSPLDPSQLN